jgi:hypothetical protein
MGRPKEAVRLARRKSIEDFIRSNPNATIQRVMDKFHTTARTVIQCRDAVGVPRLKETEDERAKRITDFYKVNPDARIKDVCISFGVTHNTAARWRELAGVKTRQEKEAAKRKQVIAFVMANPTATHAEICTTCNCGIWTAIRCREEVGLPPLSIRKHGLYTYTTKETVKLIAAIKRYINQGARA